jgi:hypothetical protein
MLEEEENENSPVENNQNNHLSIHKQNEKKLIIQIFEALKKNQEAQIDEATNLINSDYLFIFILSILNLYDYYLYSTYKKTNPEKIVESKNKKNKSKNNSISSSVSKKGEILKKISEDINSKIVSVSKYGAFDENNNFLIPFDKAKLINKDFSIVYINFMMNKSNMTRKKDLDVKNQNIRSRPEINAKSKRVYNEYRKKVMVKYSKL